VPPSMAASQLDDLRNMRVLLEEARVRSRNLAYHRHAVHRQAVHERKLGPALDELDQKMEELRALRG